MTSGWASAMGPLATHSRSRVLTDGARTVRMPLASGAPPARRDPGPAEKILPGELPDTIVILDLLQFCARSVARPIQGSFHSFFGHHHLSFDRDAGLADFFTSVNCFFARNGIAFELTPAGIIERLGPPALREALRQAVFHTGDADTDKLLEEARRRFLSPQLSDRYDAIENCGMRLRESKRWKTAIKSRPLRAC